MAGFILLILLTGAGLGIFYLKVYQSDRWQFRRRYKRIRSGILALHGKDDPIVNKCLQLTDQRLKWLEVQAEIKSPEELQRLRDEFIGTLDKIAKSPAENIDEFTDLLE